MEIMNGKELSSKIKDEIKDEVESCFKTPILAVITIGYNAAIEDMEGGKFDVGV